MVILKTKVIVIDSKFAPIGSILNVKLGYARNYLVPYGKAIYATKSNIINFKRKHKNITKVIDFNKLLNKINSILPINLELRCDKNNKLFGSIKDIDIKNIIFEKLNIKISKKFILLTNGPIKYIGNYNIKIKLYKKYIVNFLINIKPLN